MNTSKRSFFVYAQVNIEMYVFFFLFSVEIYMKKGEPQVRIDSQWSMVAVMGILVVVILVLAFTLYSMSARVAAAGGKRPDEVAIIH